MERTLHNGFSIIYLMALLFFPHRDQYQLIWIIARDWWFYGTFTIKLRIQYCGECLCVWASMTNHRTVDDCWPHHVQRKTLFISLSHIHTNWLRNQNDRIIVEHSKNVGQKKKKYSPETILHNGTSHWRHFDRITEF